MRFSVTMLAPTLRVHATFAYLGMITRAHFFALIIDIQKLKRKRRGRKRREKKEKASVGERKKGE